MKRCAFLVAALCLSFRVAAATPELLDGVAAIVNDKVITYGEVVQYARPAIQQLSRDYSGDTLRDKVRAAQMDALNNLIDRALIVHEYYDKGYKLPDNVVDTQIEEVIATDFSGNRTTFTKTLEAEKITMSEYRDRLKERIIVQAMRNRKLQQEVVVAPADIEKYYHDHLDDFKEEDQIKLRMIFIKHGEPVASVAPAVSPTIVTNAAATPAAAISPATTNAPDSAVASKGAATNAPALPAVAGATAAPAPPAAASTNGPPAAAPASATAAAPPPAATTNRPTVVTPVPGPATVAPTAAVATNATAVAVDPQRKLAEELLAKLNEGDSFESLAKVYSQAREAEKGGDWGWIGRDILQKKLSEVAFKLKPGHHSELLETPEGYYILFVEDFKAARTKPLAEVRGDIEKILLQEQRTKVQEDWVKQLREKAYIRLF